MRREEETDTSQDPSIFTVLTCPSPTPGEATVDVVVFPPRWLVMEDAFRPPGFHLNTMSEFVFLIEGGFDGQPMPKQLHGMFALTNPMVPHGPSPAEWQTAVTSHLVPEKIPPGNLGVMFESRYAILAAIPYRRR